MAHRITATFVILYILSAHTFGWILPLRSAGEKPRAATATAIANKRPPADDIQQQQLASLYSQRLSCSVTQPAQTSSPSKQMVVISRTIALGALCACFLGTSQSANAQSQVQVDRYEDENYEVEQVEGKAGLGSPGNSIAEGRFWCRVKYSSAAGCCSGLLRVVKCRVVQDSATQLVMGSIFSQCNAVVLV